MPPCALSSCWQGSSLHYQSTAAGSAVSDLSDRHTSLRSATNDDLSVPRTRHKARFGDRAFKVAASRLWNTTRHPFHSKHTNIQKETQNLLVSQSLRTAVFCTFFNVFIISFYFILFFYFIFLYFIYLFYFILFFYCFNCIGWSASAVNPIV